MGVFILAYEYLNTDEGRKLAESVAEACQDNTDASQNNTGNTSTRNIHLSQPSATNHHCGSPEVKAAVGISKTKACLDGLRVTTSGAIVAKYTIFDGARVIKHTGRLIKFIKTAVNAEIGARSVFALETSADSLKIGGRTLIRAGSTGAKAFTGVCAGLNIGLGILDIVVGSMDIRNPTKKLKGIHEFASQLDGSAKELQDIHEALTATQVSCEKKETDCWTSSCVQGEYIKNWQIHICKLNFGAVCCGNFLLWGCALFI